MSRRTAGYVSPLLFTLASLLLGSPYASAGDMPSASGDTPYHRVADEKPVKPEANPLAKPVSPAGEIRALKQQKLVKPAKKEVGVDPTAEKPATASKSDPRPNGEAAADGAEATVGEPLAPGMIEILQQEIRNAVRTRGVDDNFARFQRYSGYKLDTSAAAYTGSELAGNCRLSWYDHMLRHPFGAVAEAEQFTRDVHTAVLKDPGGLARLLPIIAEKLDLPKHDARKYAKAKTPPEALDIVKQALIEARAAQAAALAPLTKGEIQELSSYIYPVMVGQNSAAIRSTIATPAAGWWT